MYQGHCCACVGLCGHLTPPQYCYQHTQRGTFPQYMPSTPSSNHFYSGLSQDQFAQLMKKLDEVLEALSNQQETRSAEAPDATPNQGVDHHE